MTNNEDHLGLVTQTITTVPDTIFVYRGELLR